MGGGGVGNCLVLRFLVEEEDHLVHLFHLCCYLHSPAVSMRTANAHVHEERVFIILVVTSPFPIPPILTIVSIPLFLSYPVTPYAQPIIHHNHNMTTSPRPLEIVAQSNVFAMMPEILPSTVLMEGFFILTMLLYNWLEQRTKFCQ